MAFNFFGTFTTGQFKVFENFTKLQQLELVLRRKWLERQILRIGKFETTYDDAGVPVEFTASPQNSYAAKLLEAYKILGGTPEYDMLLRTRDKPVFLTSGTSISVTEDQLITGGYSNLYSNGRRNRGDQRFDRNLGLRVERLKRWQLGAIKQKRERLEYKIKRTLDYVDQLEEEFALLTRLIGSGLGSVDDQILDVKRKMRDPGAANVVVSDDIYGHDIGEVADNLLPSAEEDAEREKQRGGPRTRYDEMVDAFGRNGTA